MNTIELGGGNFHQLDAETLRGMFAFRRQVFSDRLGWKVGTHENLEFDMFDTMNPVYMLARGEQGVIEGCWRLMPTTDDYMLKDTFPQLLRGESAPSNRHVWELSRFAVDAGANAGPVQAPLNTVTLDMIRRLYEFARTCGVERFVTVTSVALERLLKRTGLPISRLGDGRAQKVGRVLSVACWVEVNEQFADVVYSGSHQSISQAA
ncbi:Acyl-homoserine-lactone synthase LuxI [hydrothermal vent metagenome]|uniref:acyl-homoserine-lactone synthase n=1 Tax=hydrothermal vent metagenome TaxID=652676 RepID=A0A3B0ZME9_9ZZZZ